MKKDLRKKKAIFMRPSMKEERHCQGIQVIKVIFSKGVLAGALNFE